MAQHRFKASLVRRFFLGSPVLWCCITVALLSLNGFVFYHNTRTLVDHDQLVTHSQNVLAGLENVLTSLDETETGERGYIITGNVSYLQPYTAAVQQLGPQVARVEALTSDNPAQQRRLPQLKTLIAAKLAEEQLTITLYRTISADAAEQAVTNDRGKNLMDELRGLIGAMKKSELDLLDRRAVDARRASEATTLTLVLASAVDVALLVGLFALIQRGISRTDQAMAEREQLLSREQTARVQAEDAVRVRDTFLSLASHELKTPLTALLGNAQLLQSRFTRQTEISERDQRRVGSITHQAERLRLLIDQLLDVSRLQYGQLSINRSRLDLSALVWRVVEEVQAMTAHHLLVVEGAEEPVIVEGDIVRLEQVLHNLLGNAIKYSPRGGRITARIVQQGTQVRVSVTDPGIGIPAAAQSQLFQRFYRASNVNTEGISSGLGIGLYVVQEVVARHGGTIEVVSAEGAGSTFTISLPLPAERDTPQPTTSL